MGGVLKGLFPSIGVSEEGALGMHGDKLQTYLTWNRLIVEHFLYGRQRGSPVFLSFDDESADLIATELDTGPGSPRDAGTPTDRFVSAVRDVVMHGNTVRLDRLPNDPTFDFPSSVAFLGIMVLAAHRMIDDDHGGEKAYFIRLGELLGCSADRAGLATGEEEPHWLAWNKFLDKRGFLPTSNAGEGPMKFLRYAISQAILRDCDRQRLIELFSQHKVPHGLDHSQLGFWLSQHTNRVYLRHGLEHFDLERRSEFLSAAYSVYEARRHSASNTAITTTMGVRPTRTIEAGLYRECDVRGVPKFYFLPRQPTRFKARPLSLILTADGSPLRLRELRPGFYRPVGPQQPFVAGPLELQVVGDARVTSMLFPQRDFWALTEDPEDPDGCYATWTRQIEVGQRFVLLCRPGLLADEMQRLRELKDLNGSRLLDWGEMRTRDNGIIEFIGCMVLSYELRAYTPSAGCEALVDALMPRSGFSVSLSGGLRDPNQSAWLEGYPPAIRARGFAGSVRVHVEQVGAKSLSVEPEELSNDGDRPLPSELLPGAYIVNASSEGVTARRMFRIIPWSAALATPDPQYLRNPDPLATASLDMCGAAFLADQGSEGREP
jgi:hypothetical protein